MKLASIFVFVCVAVNAEVLDRRRLVKSGRSRYRPARVSYNNDVQELYERRGYEQWRPFWRPTSHIADEYDLFLTLGRYTDDYKIRVKSHVEQMEPWEYCIPGLRKWRGSFQTTNAKHPDDKWETDMYIHPDAEYIPN